MKGVSQGVILGCVLILVGGGCTTSSQVAHRQGHGVHDVFAAPFDKTWRACVDAVYLNRLTVLTTNLQVAGGYISAERGLNLFSFGENVGIWVTPLSASQTRVEVVSREKGPLVLAKNWESPLLSAVTAKLGHQPVKVVANQLAGATGQATNAVPALSPTGNSARGERVQSLPVDPAPLRFQSTRLNDIGDLENRRQELRTVQKLRQEELRLETDPRRREHLQAELGYLDAELQSVEGRLRQ